MNFFGPIARLIWTEKMKLSRELDLPKWKRIVFLLVMRLGVVLLYPLFYF